MLQLTIDEYRVGWVCALRSEYAAAKAMLDETHQMVSRQDRADTNSYTLGRIHNHNVAIACLPLGVDGMNAAAIVATNLYRTFQSVRFVLMVGVGGGIPNLQKGIDIRLGDIVVSQPSGSHGGVVQYDKGKSHDGGLFESKGWINKPPTVLLTALSNLTAQHEIEDSRVAKYLEQMIQNHPKMQRRGYSFPIQEDDVLRCAHSPQTDSCEHCENRKVKREPRGSTQPAIHYGLVASGSQVIKSATHRDQIRDGCGGAICVEMEAAGLMDNFPCLVIRGISDYADSSKNDIWQNYAAATAAAFAKELLLHVCVEQICYERPIQEILSFLPEAREYFQHQEAHNEQQRAHNWRQELRAHHQEIQRVPVVAQAMYDSRSGGHGQCHPNTRVDLLQSVRSWARDAEGSSIFWLNGAAGTGKSTISWTVAKLLTDLGTSASVALGASFFFKRDEVERASAALLFPTIACQLATKVHNFDVFLAQALRVDSHICTKSLVEQFKKLICKPLQQSDSTGGHKTYIVIIDALDECKNEDDIRLVLQLWSMLPQNSTVRLRLFLTCRPERVICHSFKQMPTNTYRDMVLHEVPWPIIQHDIHAFLTTALDEVRRDYNLTIDDDLINEKLTEDWPGHQALQELTKKAMPLFIMAATIHRLLRKTDCPRQRLENILRSEQSPHLSEMGKIYITVLQAMTAVFQDNEEISRAHDQFRTIVGAIVTLTEPLSRTALAALLHIRSVEVQVCLRPLHSVLEVPSDRDAPVRPLHLSFGEYLTSQEARNTPYWIDTKAAHAFLWRQCLQLLSYSTGLRENVCNLEHPGVLYSTVPSAQISRCLRPEIRYACRYWVHHVQHSGQQLQDDDEAHVFFKEHFLHWLEALSLIGRISEITGFLSVLQSCISSTASNLTAFLEDAQRFILAHRYVISLAPLQIYSSAIIFSPQQSLVRMACSHIPSWIQQCPRSDMQWGPELQKLEGHSDGVKTVWFSSNGSTLISGSWDGTIRLWEVQTGREIQKIEGHSRIEAVSSSTCGSILASVSWGGTIQLWETRTGREVHKIEGHFEARAISLSPDGSLLALGSHDYTIQLLEVQTGQQVQTLCGHSDRVEAVSFSPDGSLIASGSWDRTIRIWKVQTGQEMRKLEGHSDWVKAVSFSHDGCLIASGSSDNTVRVWKVQTGREIQKLEGHSHWVTTVSFSTNRFLLASGSFDNTIRLWNVQTRQPRRTDHTGREVQRLEGHSGGVEAVSFSPDGSLLASGSWDKTIRMWKVETGRETQKRDGRSKEVYAMSFSSNGSLLAALSDYTIWVWEVQTGRKVQTFRNKFFVHTISFADDATLIAGREHITISGCTTCAADHNASSAEAAGEGVITVSDEWIRHQGQNLLWLPREYRGLAVSQGNTLAVGAKSGRISIFRFKFA